MDVQKGNPIADSIGGLPMRIWKGATAGAGCFANGQAAHYRVKGIEQFQRKESTESIIQPFEQQPVPVQKFALGFFFVGVLLGMLVMKKSSDCS